MGTKKTKPKNDIRKVESGNEVRVAKVIFQSKVLKIKFILIDLNFFFSQDIITKAKYFCLCSDDD